MHDSLLQSQSSQNRKLCLFLVGVKCFVRQRKLQMTNHNRKEVGRCDPDYNNNNNNNNGMGAISRRSCLLTAEAAAARPYEILHISAGAFLNLKKCQHVFILQTAKHGLFFCQGHANWFPLNNFSFNTNCSVLRKDFQLKSKAKEKQCVIRLSEPQMSG